MKHFAALFGLSLLSLASSSASLAQSGFSTPAFNINTVFVSSGGNMTFRVYGMPAMPACPSATTWAYVDTSDPGYQVKVAALLSAQAQGKQVVLNIQPTDFYSNGGTFCHITEFAFSG